ncbi:MAG TPA: glucose-1-phosphate cytidylyltransferase [Candidatus Omnitrophica bacterium]|nr:MAG: glucose-1-phosphate cytidylyltransferase [Omnitrophica WOR_2 bacterium GWA2_45_18]OGX19886.1 MAG: glucose-1-phosphate cytidylyltransferase [Omnitrophica WOR_2 bacterium GWC2_45_7]HBR15952.1 glucose-1-phosphate cytidylyltransferase [Candidatus Omnitrophota bacterium]
MKVVTLAGGYGTRLSEETVHKPKPMVEIGGLPILWHILKIYASAGFAEFIIALGYKGEVIKDYFLNYYYQRHDLSIDLKKGDVKVHEGGRDRWVVHCVDTGLNTGTGGRIKRLQPWLGNETFLMTYGDGVSNVDIKELLAFHRKHGKLATIMAVHPPSRFGGLEFDVDRVTRFVEKPQIGQGWINGGYFVLEPGVFDYIDGDETMFEQEPLERLAEDNQLMAFKHPDFWQCMDTLRDVRLLEDLWKKGEAPWKVWKD